MPRKLRPDPDQHDVGHLERGEIDHRRHHHRRDVQEEDAPGRCPHGQRRGHEEPLPQFQNLGANGAQEDRDARDRQHDDHVGHARLEDEEHDDREQHRRKAHDRVGDAQEQGRERPALEPGVEAEAAADHRRAEYGEAGDQHGVLAGDDDAGEQAAPERIGAENVEPGPVEVEGRSVALHQVHRPRLVPEQRRTEDRAEENQDQEGSGSRGELVLAKGREDLAKRRVRRFAAGGGYSGCHLSCAGCGDRRGHR